ncbi:hypothetical protein [Nocardioides sp. zg-1228]|uniref:hypothetical protein n=1 Tax=Nocardioides sp. zg-1228 TaxID=2763008 RepID=UPI001642769D|nr:hypothetical protein [Nocardioides sp. zg-1228]MBC2932644.1 hypothetical protein [Nocardioides sp. zg-1228]QSF58128.1 hypothetical protein JX575_02620 [Nocardioides sp. zg-1228]
MLTDDDLTRRLRAAFAEEAADLTYAGPVPRARTRPAWARPGLLALPVAGAVAAAALVAGSTGPSTAPPAPSPTAADASSSPAGVRTVAEEIRLAGMTFTVERDADDVAVGDQLLRVYDPGQLPDWARPVELEAGAAAKVWVGTDPATGSTVLLVQSPVRWGGRLTGLASPSISVEQMESIARTGRLS